MTLYDVLEVSPTASKETIQAAYKAMARKYHPDVNPSAEEWMKTINTAYEILIDDNKRAQYDAQLYSGQQSAATKEEPTKNASTPLITFADEWPNWLRWALAIPIVIFVQWMARAILDQLLHWGWGVVPNGFISTLADFTIVIYISVILFAYIVPTHKLMASIIFSITIGVWYVMAFTSNVIYRTYIVQSLAATIICYLSAIVSLVYSCIHINKYYKKA